MEYGFFAGSYGSRQEENVIRFSLDADTGEIARIYGCEGIENPSWLTLHPGGSVLYAVEELTPEGNIRAFRIEDKGLTPLASLSTRGADPCHICLDGTAGHLLAANYTSGSLSVYGLDGAGIPLRATDFVRHERRGAGEAAGEEGAGVDPARQEGPHIHFSEIMGPKAFLVDLGIDKVCVYDWDGGRGTLRRTSGYMAFPAGAGPRHLAAHPRIEGLLYVVCELGNKLAVFREREGNYVLEDMLPTLPKSYQGENTAAAIRIWDDLLMVSNRGHDSIAVFSLGDDGRPSLEQIVPTGGRTPRDFQILGEYVVVANQGSDAITVLRIDSGAGRLEQTGISVPMGRPTCICPTGAELHGWHCATIRHFPVPRA